LWAFSESEAAANEVAAVSSVITSSAGGSFTVVSVDEAGAGLAGEDKIVLKGTGPLAGSPEAAAEALAQAAMDANPDVILVGSTRNG